MDPGPIVSEVLAVAVQAKGLFVSRSTEVLPFYMILTSFAVGGLWFVYGCMLKDDFIKIPNFMGFALATVQLIPFIVFKSKKASVKNVDDKNVDSP